MQKKRLSAGEVGMGAFVEWAVFVSQRFRKKSPPTREVLKVYESWSRRMTRSLGSCRSARSWIADRLSAMTRMVWLSTFPLVSAHYSGATARGSHRLPPRSGREQEAVEKKSASNAVFVNRRRAGRSSQSLIESDLAEKASPAYVSGCGTLGPAANQFGQGRKVRCAALSASWAGVRSLGRSWMRSNAWNIAATIPPVSQRSKMAG